MEYIFGAFIGIVCTYIFMRYIQVNSSKNSADDLSKTNEGTLEKPIVAAKIVLKNKDPRFPSSRFTKMEYILLVPKQPRIRVLFQFDRENNERYDMKIVSSKSGPDSDKALCNFI